MPALEFRRIFSRTAFAMIVVTFRPFRRARSSFSTGVDALLVDDAHAGSRYPQTHETLFALDPEAMVVQIRQEPARVLRCEWDTLFPVIGRLPVTWQTLDMVNASKILLISRYVRPSGGGKATIYTGSGSPVNLVGAPYRGRVRPASSRPVADHEVVEHAHIDQRQRIAQAHRDPLVGLARLGDSGRVVVAGSPPRRCAAALRTTSRGCTLAPSMVPRKHLLERQHAVRLSRNSTRTPRTGSRAAAPCSTGGVSGDSAGAAAFRCSPRWRRASSSIACNWANLAARRVRRRTERCLIGRQQGCADHRNVAAGRASSTALVRPGAQEDRQQFGVAQILCGPAAAQTFARTFPPIRPIPDRHHAILLP